jgi:hypothetical protein
MGEAARKRRKQLMAEQRGWKPPFEPVTFDQLLEAIHAAGWPEKVILHPVDFIVCAQTGSVRVTADVEKGVSYYYVCNTRVEPMPAKPGTVDLSDRHESRIVSPVR